MSDILPSLNQLLSIFSKPTQQRSLDYVHQIDMDTLEIHHTEQTVSVGALIEGTDEYDCSIRYNRRLQKITHTECSCPVGYRCKHVAALVRWMHAHLTEAETTEGSETAWRQMRATLAAEQWLARLQQQLQRYEHTAADGLSPLVYSLTLVGGKLRLGVHKVRRSKAGAIQAHETYTAFDNAASGKLTMPETARQTFRKLYSHARSTQEEAYYFHDLNITALPLPLLRTLLTENQTYWQARSRDPFRPDTPLQWQEETGRLSWAWQSAEHSHGERLIILWDDGSGESHILGEDTPLRLLPSDPPSVLDTQRLTVTAADGALPLEIVQQLAAMPDIPAETALKLEAVFTGHRLTRDLPVPAAARETTSLHGAPQPVIRFEKSPTHAVMYNALSLPDHPVQTTLLYRYAGGDVAADDTAPFFLGRSNGQTVRQYRDLAAEEAAFNALKKCLKPLKRPLHTTALNMSEILPVLLPVNRLEQAGWLVEQQADSPVNVQTASAAEWSLHEADDGGHWFDIGATIRDESGTPHDFLEVVGTLLQKHAYLFNPAITANLPPNYYFTVMLDEHRPPLAVSLQEIQPFLTHLRGLLNREERRVDGYDAVQMSDLAHHLGMPWQMPDSLQRLADTLSRGYRSTLPTPQGFQGELRPYQQQGLAWLQFLRETAHGGILADDMGLGKTAQTLAHILLEKQAGRLNGRPVLIVAPTSLMHNWQQEAAKFTPDLSVLLLHGAARHQAFADTSSHDIVLTTYPLLSRDEAALLPHRFHQIILDEAQHIKNPHSKAAQVLRRLPSEHRLCLTGTPMENHLGELWSLFHFVMPGFLGSQETFNKKYRHPIEKKNDEAQRRHLANRVRPFVLRRLKTEVATELPPKTTIEISIPMNDAQSKRYEAVRAAMQRNIRQIIAEQGFKRSQIQILDALLKLRQVCCHPALLDSDGHDADGKKAAPSAKLEHLVEMVQNMVAEGRKILIFSQFTTMLALIEQALGKHHIRSVKLTGQTKKRAEVIDTFQQTDVPVFLISLKAGGTGLNLTAADTVIHYDPWWNPAAENQASDRAWRIGQDKPVFVYKLITAQSIEEKINALQQSKAHLAESVLSTDREGEAKFSEADIMALLERD